MEIIKLIALSLAAVLILTACASSNKELLSYQQSSFRAHVSWQLEDECFEALLTSVITGGARTLSLEFTAPDELVGVCVHRAGDKAIASLGEFEISSPAANRLLAITEFFNIDATLKESSLERIDGTDFNKIEATNADGDLYTLYLSPTGLPRRICGMLSGSLCTLDVLSFEIIPQ